jgi:23S rRNA pseudouridine1911/1915/1917 synthase
MSNKTLSYKSPPDTNLIRLDRPCSGVVVFAKTISAASKLNLSFKNRLVDKNYVCVVNGETEQKRSLQNMMQKTQGEKVNVFDMTKAKDNYLVEAKLQYESLLVIQGGADINSKQTLIKVELDTGRKHQIRAQMAHIGKL